MPMEREGPAPLFENDNLNENENQFDLANDTNYQLTEFLVALGLIVGFTDILLAYWANPESTVYNACLGLPRQLPNTLFCGGGLFYIFKRQFEAEQFRERQRLLRDQNHDLDAEPLLPLLRPNRV